MGTNGTLGFVIDGQRKITYNHYDSYPSALGKSVLEFAAQITDIEAVRVAARALVAVDENGTPSAGQREALAEYHQNVSNGMDWYSYLRGTQGDLALTLAVGYYTEHDDPEEFEYVIDLDAETFTATNFENTVTRPLSDLPTVEDLIAVLGD